MAMVPKAKDMAAGRRKRLELSAARGTYPTPIGEIVAPYDSAKAKLDRGGAADRDEYETDPEFGFRTPRKKGK